MAQFSCDHCGAAVVLSTGAGRTHPVRAGLSVAVPNAFPIATCQLCGETYLTTAEAEALANAIPHPTRD